MVETEEGSYILNSRDMCMIGHIPELLAAGVTSLKIEGRAKSAYYVSVVTNAYRAALNFHLKNPGEPLPAWIPEELEKISHREYSTGFYMGGEPGQETRSGPFPEKPVLPGRYGGCIGARPGALHSALGPYLR